MNTFRAWAPHRVVAGEVVSAITTQGYRKFWDDLGMKMDPVQFAELDRRVTVAEEVTRMIYRIMDLHPNVLDASSTEDKP